MTFDDSSLPPVRPEDAAGLATAVAGSVLVAGDPGYDDECAVFNLNHELAPAVVVVAQSAADVQAAVAFAARQHRPVLLKTTGHQMAGAAHGAVLITTHRMNDVAIDPVGRTARVGAGAIWADVIEKAAEAGLAPLNGSSAGGRSVRLHPRRRSQSHPRPRDENRMKPRKNRCCGVSCTER